jgi:t-SNARE complex subunit (syntaxin)
MERDVDEDAHNDQAPYNEPGRAGEDTDHAILELRIQGKKVPLGWPVTVVIVLLAVAVVATLLVQTLT